MERDSTDALSFWLQTQQHIHENIKFADTKAVQIIAINVALIGGLYLATEDLAEPLRLAALLVAAALGAGILFAVSVIRPRGEHNRARGPGIVDAIRIAQYSEQEFKARCASASPEDLLKELQEFVYDRARIDDAKYDKLRWAIALSLIAWVLAFFLVAFIRHVAA